MKRMLIWAACAALLLGSARAAVAVRMGDAAALLTEDGAEIVAEGVYEDIVNLGEGLFAATEDGARYALMDAGGVLLSEARYDELRLRGGLLYARRDGGWGLLAANGAELGAFDYEAILPIGAGGAWALREADELTAVLLLDAAGGERDSGLRVRGAGEPGEGLLPLEFADGLWGYCDAAGAVAIPARFDWAGRFTCGRAPAVSGGRYGAIDESGEWIIAPRYDFLQVSEEGFILAAGDEGVEALAADGSIIATYAGEGAWGALAGAGYIVGDAEALRVYDATGALLAELAPDASVSEGVGAQLIVSTGMWGEKCVRLPGSRARYQNLYPLGMSGDTALYACLQADTARYQNDLLHEIQISVDMDSARYGVVNGAGEMLLGCVFSSVELLAEDRLLVHAHRQWRVVDTDGRVYWRSRVRQTEAPSS